MGENMIHICMFLSTGNKISVPRKQMTCCMVKLCCQSVPCKWLVIHNNGLHLGNYIQVHVRFRQLLTMFQRYGDLCRASLKPLGPIGTRAYGVPHWSHLLSTVQVHTTTHCMFKNSFTENSNDNFVMGTASPKASPGCIVAFQIPFSVYCI